MKSQNEAILNYMRSGKKVDPMSALKLFDCWALSSRISEIEGNSGHKLMLKPGETIVRKSVANAQKSKRWTEYRIVKAVAA